ncbi:MAG TPA: maleylpyruvate isomerase family mycothiol-dependent enzyme [Actinocrinis sp.]|nr:maleylpyruvate isomerase family mycothiol-dependent enzyme [Actinocrinis sp.]
MADLADWIAAVRSSHDRFTALVLPLDDEQVQHPSYADDWSVAQVASHLGSQAEIFTLILEAGLTGGEAPGGEKFRPIWDVWDNRPALLQVTESVRVNEEFVSRIEKLSQAERADFSVNFFGRQLDLTGFLGMRLGEHALHTWDIAVALDLAATVSPDAVELLIDILPGTVAHAGQAAEQARTLAIETVDPVRRFTLTTGPEVALTHDSAADTAPAQLVLPAEELIRLVYGRLDPEHTSAGLPGHEVVPELRQVFKGF